MPMPTAHHIHQLLETVCDPEIPVLTVADLGIVRDVRIHDDGTVEVIITPTYSGCPAMNTIEINIRAALQTGGYDQVKVTTVLSPAWTTDWLSPEAQEKLRRYGIAPPVKEVLGDNPFAPPPLVPCPRCDSENTNLVSQFGATACKSLYVCDACKEPFEYFKHF